MLHCRRKNATPALEMGEPASIVLNGLSIGVGRLRNNLGIVALTGDESPYYERAFVAAQFIARLEHE